MSLYFFNNQKKTKEKFKNMKWKLRDMLCIYLTPDHFLRKRTNMIKKNFIENYLRLKRNTK